MTLALEPAARSGTARARARARMLAGALAGAGILVQISYPLTSGGVSVLVTVLSVLLLSGAALAHAFSQSRSAWAPLAVLLSAAGVGLACEAVGVRTGFPFGSYEYTGLLGPKLLGVPVLVPLAWTMLAYPCLLLGRRLGHGRRWRTVVLGGLCLASWDLFLDPQMIRLGAWEWHHPAPALPGVPGIPLTNYAGWILVSLVMIAVLDRVVQTSSSSSSRSAADELVPAAVLAWTWLGSAVGNLVFFGRPWAGLWGLVAMGLFALPYLRQLRERP